MKMIKCWHDRTKKGDGSKGRMLLAASLLAAGVIFVGCDNAQPKIQYVPDMADAPTLKPQENYLEPPEHSVAMNAVLYPKTPEEAAANLKNPLPQDDRVLKLGEKMYNTYCIPCHGAAGKGDGSIVDVYIQPPDITNATYAAKADGHFFHVMTFGIRVMPGYGHATLPHERWAMVHYLRSLQGKIPAPSQQAPSVPAPTSGGDK